MSLGNQIAGAIILLATILLAGCGGGGGGGGGGSPTVEVTTTVFAAGDIGDCEDQPAVASMPARTAALVAAGDAPVLTLGDTTYPVGAPTEFTNCFHPTWGAFKSRIRPTVGNHEYLTPGAEGYYSYFGAQAGPDRRGYYSFDAGGWHFISLNSNIDAGVDSAQYLWLVADLAASRSTACTIAYWHYPVFSSGLHGNNVHMAKIFDALYGAGVDIVLSGHDHHYERFAPQTADGVGDPSRGIRAFVVGTGGAELYPLGTRRANSEVLDNTVHGVFRLVLGEGKYSWQFLPVGGGAARDSGSDVCHR